jgi:ABC-type sugar transport system ATPase subunit
VISSSDTKELAEVCHRVVVLNGGRAVGELSGATLTEEAVLHMSFDVSAAAVAAS